MNDLDRAWLEDWLEEEVEGGGSRIIHAATLIRKLLTGATAAERWSRLMSCQRIRVLGSARLGRTDAHLGLELWGVHPGEHPDGHPTLIAFVDGLEGTRSAFDPSQKAGTPVGTGVDPRGTGV